MERLFYGVTRRKASSRINQRADKGGRNRNKCTRGGRCNYRKIGEKTNKKVKGKAVGEDELENEVWIYSGKKITEKITILINKIWKREGLSDGWKEGIIRNF